MLALCGLAAGGGRRGAHQCDSVGVVRDALGLRLWPPHSGCCCWPACSSWWPGGSGGPQAAEPCDRPCNERATRALLFVARNGHFEARRGRTKKGTDHCLCRSGTLFVWIGGDESHRAPSGRSSRFSPCTLPSHRRTPKALGVLLYERVTRIELALSAWEADVLPLNYTRGGSLPCRQYALWGRSAMTSTGPNRCRAHRPTYRYR